MFTSVIGDHTLITITMKLSVSESEQNPIVNHIPQNSIISSPSSTQIGVSSKYRDENASRATRQLSSNNKYLSFYLTFANCDFITSSISVLLLHCLLKNCLLAVNSL